MWDSEFQVRNRLIFELRNQYDEFIHFRNHIKTQLNCNLLFSQVFGMRLNYSLLKWGLEIWVSAIPRDRFGMKSDKWLSLMWKSSDR